MAIVQSYPHYAIKGPLYLPENVLTMTQSLIPSKPNSRAWVLDSGRFEKHCPFSESV